jgi:hypothetical protein
MKRSTIGMLVAGMLCGCGAPAMTPAPAVPQPQGTRAMSDAGMRQAVLQAGRDLYARSDASHDRYLTVDEFAATGWKAPDFAGADRNQDNRLSEREFLAFYLKANTWAPQLRASVVKDMTRLDTDGSGRVSLAEWRSAIAHLPVQQQIDSMAMFHMSDKGRDQQLTPSEIEDLLAWWLVAAFQQDDPISALPAFLR